MFFETVVQTESNYEVLTQVFKEYLQTELNLVTTEEYKNDAKKFIELSINKYDSTVIKLQLWEKCRKNSGFKPEGSLERDHAN